MFEPLAITAHLAGSIAISRPEDIALDGILAYEVLRRHFGADFYSLPDPKECLYFARPPLEQRGQPSEWARVATTGMIWQQPALSIKDESFWYWACSSAQIDVQGRDRQYWNKRFETAPALSDHIDFGGRVEKVLIEAGRYKAYHMPLSTLVCESVTWYAYGERDAIADLLCPVSAIGKKRNYGHGAIRKITVSPIEQDYSEWRDGRLMRPIPGLIIKDVAPLLLQFIGFRPPQWHPLNQAICVVKGERFV